MLKGNDLTEQQCIRTCEHYIFVTRGEGGLHKVPVPVSQNFKPDLLDNQKVAIRNDTSSARSRRDVSSADLFGTGTISTAVEISNLENRHSAV